MNILEIEGDGRKLLEYLYPITDFYQIDEVLVAYMFIAYQEGNKKLHIVTLSYFEKSAIRLLDCYTTTFFPNKFTADKIKRDEIFLTYDELKKYMGQNQIFISDSWDRSLIRKAEKYFKELKPADIIIHI